MHLGLSALGDLEPSLLSRFDLPRSIIMLTCYLFVLNKLWTLCTFLTPLFATPILCFHHLTDSFAKSRGGGVPQPPKFRQTQLTGTPHRADNGHKSLDLAGYAWREH
jgi:hypothetical protein